MIVGGGLKLSLNHLVPPALGSVLKSVCVCVVWDVGWAKRCQQSRRKLMLSMDSLVLELGAAGGRPQNHPKPCRNTPRNNRSPYGNICSIPVWLWWLVLLIDCFGIPMIFHGFLWISLDFLGLPWIYLDFGRFQGPQAQVPARTSAGLSAGLGAGLHQGLH